MFKDYYTTLYQEPAGISVELAGGFLAEAKMTKLTAAQTEELEESMSMSEIRAAINAIAKNKTPGMDGLPIEFYDSYEEVLAPKLRDMYMEAFEVGQLPSTMEEAMIVVLPKQGRDPLQVGSYRPLSMLNMDYKILSKVLANRLLPLVSSVVHNDQTGFIPGRSTFANIRRCIASASDTDIHLETPRKANTSLRHPDE